MTEKQLLEAIRDLAGRFGWLVYHTHQSTRSEPGFPDIVLCKGDRVLFYELKAEGKAATDAQAIWLEALQGTRAEARLVTPDNWLSGQVEQDLRWSNEREFEKLTGVSLAEARGE